MFACGLHADMQPRPGSAVGRVLVFNGCNHLGQGACDGPTACKQARTCAWQHTRCACGVRPRRACCSGWMYAKLC